MNTEKINAIITGTTGMVGEGVMHECLESPYVESVLIINRKASGHSHPKLKEILHADFNDISPIADQLKGYNACYFCAGVSSVGMKEEEFYKLAYTLTLNFAKKLSETNPNLTFTYISGAATDSTEKGKVMWARVKGKTENDLMKLPFTRVFNFRPGYLQPTEGLKNTLKYYKYITWMYPLLTRITRNSVSTLAELGQAMINVTRFGYEKQIIEVKDILVLSKKG